MPQLEITTFPSQIFWLVVSFLMLYLIMSRIIIPRISSVIKSRESEIKNNIHISEHMYKDTEIINNEYEEIKKNIEDEAREIINHLKETTNKKITNSTELLKKKRSHIFCFFPEIPYQNIKGKSVALRGDP